MASEVLPPRAAGVSARRVLLKREGTFGFSLGGDAPVCVYDVAPGGSAQKCGMRVGDQITHINGIFVGNWTYSHVVDFLRQSGDTVELIVSSVGDLPPPERRIPRPSSSSASPVKYGPTARQWADRALSSTVRNALMSNGASSPEAAVPSARTTTSTTGSPRRVASNEFDVLYLGSVPVKPPRSSWSFLNVAYAVSDINERVHGEHVQPVVPGAPPALDGTRRRLSSEGSDGARNTGRTGGKVRGELMRLRISQHAMTIAQPNSPRKTTFAASAVAFSELSHTHRNQCILVTGRPSEGYRCHVFESSDASAVVSLLQKLSPNEHAVSPAGTRTVGSFSPRKRERQPPLRAVDPTEDAELVASLRKLPYCISPEQLSVSLPSISAQDGSTLLIRDVFRLNAKVNGRSATAEVFRHPRMPRFPKEDRPACVLSEVKSCRRLLKVRHSNIARFLGVGIQQFEGRLYALFLYEKQPSDAMSLSQLLQVSVEQGASGQYVVPNMLTSLRQKLRMAKAAASAMEHLHENKIIHGCISPDMVLVSDSQGVRVTGFGHAHMLVASCKNTAWEPYLAPEVLSDPKAVAAASDVYSLAMTIYAVIAWRGQETSLTGTSEAAPLLRLRSKELVHAVAVRNNRPTLPEDIPGDLRKLLKQSWASDPRRRINMSGLAFRLADLLDDEDSDSSSDHESDDVTDEQLNAIIAQRRKSEQSDTDDVPSWALPPQRARQQASSVKAKLANRRKTPHVARTRSRVEAEESNHATPRTRLFQNQASPEPSPSQTDARRSSDSTSSPVVSPRRQSSRDRDSRVPPQKGAAKSSSTPRHKPPAFPSPDTMERMRNMRDVFEKDGAVSSSTPNLRKLSESTADSGRSASLSSLRRSALAQTMESFDGEVELKFASPRSASISRPGHAPTQVDEADAERDERVPTPLSESETEPNEDAYTAAETSKVHSVERSDGTVEPAPIVSREGHEFAFSAEGESIEEDIEASFVPDDDTFMVAQKLASNLDALEETEAEPNQADTSNTVPVDENMFDDLDLSLPEQSLPEDAAEKSSAAEVFDDQKKLSQHAKEEEVVPTPNEEKTPDSVTSELIQAAASSHHLSTGKLRVPVTRDASKTSYELAQAEPLMGESNLSVSSSDAVVPAQPQATDKQASEGAAVLAADQVSQEHQAGDEELPAQIAQSESAATDNRQAESNEADENVAAPSAASHQPGIDGQGGQEDAYQQGLGPMELAQVDSYTEEANSAAPEVQAQAQEEEDDDDDDDFFAMLKRAKQSEKEQQMSWRPEDELEGAASADPDLVGPKRWAKNFNYLLADPEGMQAFVDFAKTIFCEENALFWQETQRLKTVPDHQVQAECERIFNKYLGTVSTGSKAPMAGGPRMSLNIDGPIRTDIEKAILGGNPSRDCFAMAQKQIYHLMKLDTYPRFLSSDMFRDALDDAEGSSYAGGIDDHADATSIGTSISQVKDDTAASEEDSHARSQFAEDAQPTDQSSQQQTMNGSTASASDDSRASKPKAVKRFKSAMAKKLKFGRKQRTGKDKGKVEAGDDNDSIASHGSSGAAAQRSPSRRRRFSFSPTKKQHKRHSTASSAAGSNTLADDKDEVASSVGVVDEAIEEQREEISGTPCIVRVFSPEGSSTVVSAGPSTPLEKALTTFLSKMNITKDEFILSLSTDNIGRKVEWTTPMSEVATQELHLIRVGLADSSYSEV